MKKPKVVGGLDKSVHVHQSDKINFDLKIDLKFQLTPKQKEFIELLEDKNTKWVFLRGSAGSAKSYIAIYAGLLALKAKKVSHLSYIRQPVESSSHNLGFLPGTADEKIKPYLMPLMDKLGELLNREYIKRLEKENRIQGNTLGFIRGASYNANFIIADESQNFSVSDFLLAMTRKGRFSKMVFCGDIRQSDVKNSGFSTVYNLFDNEESKKQGIHTFKFGREDIMREESIIYILVLLCHIKKGKRV